MVGRLTERPLLPPELRLVARDGHTMQRAFDRYGVDLTIEDIELIAELVREGHSVLEHVGSRWPRSVHWVYFQDTSLRVVYDHRFANIVTVLPPEDREERG
jgi:hypothetical protein